MKAVGRTSNDKKKIAPVQPEHRMENNLCRSHDCLAGYVF